MEIDIVKEKKTKKGKYEKAYSSERLETLNSRLWLMTRTNFLKGSNPGDDWWCFHRVSWKEQQIMGRFARFLFIQGPSRRTLQCTEASALIRGVYPEL